jgi:hypothetical protein
MSQSTIATKMHSQTQCHIKINVIYLRKLWFAWVLVGSGWAGFNLDKEQDFSSWCTLVSYLVMREAQGT